MLIAKNELRQRVQRWLTSGALFPAPQTSWAGYGSGRVCGVCSSIVHRDEVEYEVAGGVNGKVFAHRLCYVIWREESEAGTTDVTD
jgi:hypothetical protein